MIVLTAIGAFFARIWRWIKETAWVQPLLIVGIIFAIIFSIPSIVNGVKSLNESMASSETYYRQFQYSLAGGQDSQADKVTDYIYRKSNDSTVPLDEKLGEKFFLVYVSEECASCKEVKGGFETFQQKFDTTFNPNDGTKFSMVTIFTDEVTSETTSKQTAFVQYMERHQSFFENAAAVGWNSAYKTNGHISEDDLKNVEQVDPDNFLTPTIMLIDFSNGVNSPEYGVSEIMFGVEGDTDYKRAELLLDCWKHIGEFSLDKKKE